MEQIANHQVTRMPRERGATLVLFTLMMAMVGIPLVGLAIDGSIVFWAKARLSAAVDASALAAGRSFNIKQTPTQNAATVVSVALQWFNANFPNGWLGTTVVGGAPTIDYVPSSTAAQLVTVSASANVPTLFMRIVGFDSVTVAASAQSARRNITAVLILDISGSMAGTPCSTMKTVAATFVNTTFSDNFDAVGLITFSTTIAKNDSPDLTFKTKITTDINAISCGGSTSTAQALNAAYTDIRNYNTPGSSNVVILFTDGQPNGIVATFPIRRVADARYGTGGNYGSYTSKTVQPASTCAVDPTTNPTDTLTGLMTQNASTGDLGETLGVIDSTPITGGGLIAAPGCSFLKNEAKARLDVAYIPHYDNFINPATGTGNRTDGQYGTYGTYYGTGVSVPATFTSADGPLTPASYWGFIRPDYQDTGVVAASVNAADYQGAVIRNDLTFKPIIYTIGLGGNPGKPIDQVFLSRLANDSGSPIHTPALATGTFAYASNSSQLAAAFAQIASQILRLSK